MRHCAILTMDCLDDFDEYDALIQAPLSKLGWSSEFVSWRAKNVDWDKFEAVIIRSPWDYQSDAASFLSVLEAIEKSSARLENSYDIVQWNIDKQYLKELEEKGVDIVPTYWEQAFSSEKVAGYFEYYQCEQLIIKPLISANADNTFWLNKANYFEELANLDKVFLNGPCMVQPFIQEIVEEGEYSLFYFNGELSHAIIKKPKSGDFRVQEEHGGLITPTAPEKDLIDTSSRANQVIAALHGTPLYARYDFVRYQDRFVMMEAELIEPSLYFNMDESSPERFAKAFVQRMDEL